MAGDLGRTELGPDPERINELSRDFWRSAILRAGIKLGVFEVLQDQSMTSDQIAERVGGAPRFVQAFLNTCTVLGLLDASGGKYRNSTAAFNFLIKGKPKYVGDLVLHITNHWASWGQLDLLIRQGKTLLPFESGYVDVPTYWTDYMMGQHNRATSGQGDELVRGVDLSGRSRLLDLGGGAGSYSMALCAANPQLHAVVLDQKEPLALAKELVDKEGLQDQISLLEGDFNTVELGQDYDVVLISGVVLIKSPEDCRRLFQKAYGALMPGGLIIVQDFMRVDRSPGRNLMDTLMDMYVLIAFDPGAGDRPGEEIAGWLEDAGFQNSRQVALPTHLALVLAEKPGPLHLG